VGIFGAASRVIMGHATDRAGDILFILNLLPALAAAALGLILLAGLVPILVWLGAAVFGASVAVNAIVMIALVKEVGPKATGVASGRVMIGFFSAFIVAPIGFGALVDATQSYILPWSVLTAAMVITSISVWFMRLLRRRRSTLQDPSAGISS
jgi:cyanate permease